MSDDLGCYQVQLTAVSVIATRMGMRVYLEPRDKPERLTFKVFSDDYTGRLTITVEDLEQRLMTNLRAELDRSLGCGKNHA
jgi:hypothetical protein